MFNLQSAKTLENKGNRDIRETGSRAAGYQIIRTREDGVQKTMDVEESITNNQ